MAPYDVFWKQGPERALTAAYLNGGLAKKEIRDAADKIDSDLRRAPRFVGIKGNGNVRCHSIGPLSAIYEIDEKTKAVHLLVLKFPPF